MKFGGTSVGRPERMYQVKDLITQGTEPTLVVLSALSGTTNALVGIGAALAAADSSQAADRHGSRGSALRQGGSCRAATRRLL